MAGLGLSIAEVLGWDAESVREVFLAGKDRATTTMDVSANLSVLDVFDTWGGDTAEAARSSIAITRQDLDEHARQVMEVAVAAEAAANEIENIRKLLRDLIAEIEAKGGGCRWQFGTQALREVRSIGPLRLWERR